MARRQEAGRERSTTRGIQAASNVGGESVGLAPQLLVLVGDHGADRRDLRCLCRIQRTTGLGVILAAKVHDLMALEGADDGDLVHLLGKFGKQLVGEIQAVAHLANVQILRRALAFLEIKGINMAEGTCQLNHNGESRGSAGIGMACRPRVDRPERLLRE